jgi:hypothetical protein
VSLSSNILRNILRLALFSIDSAADYLSGSGLLTAVVLGRVAGVQAARQRSANA